MVSVNRMDAVLKYLLGWGGGGVITAGAGLLYPS